MRLRKSGLYANVIGINIKNSEFESYSKRKKIQTPTQNTNEIFAVATELFEQVWKRDPIRLIGVATTQLQSEPPIQLNMFDSLSKQSSNVKKLDESIDKIREKYGNKYLVRGSLLNLNKDCNS
jgi:DNA polymerase-4